VVEGRTAAIKRMRALFSPTALTTNTGPYVSRSRSTPSSDAPNPES